MLALVTCTCPGYVAAKFESSIFCTGVCGLGGAPVCLQQFGCQQFDGIAGALVVQPHQLAGSKCNKMHHPMSSTIRWYSTLHEAK